MPRSPIGLLVAALTLATLPACSTDPAGLVAPTKPTSQSRVKKAVTQPADSPIPELAAANAAPEQPGRNAEPLPQPPKLTPGNEHRPLNPEKTLLLELAPDPTDPAKKTGVRVLVAAEVCMRQGPLEVLLCKANTKEHEAILRTIPQPAPDGRQTTLDAQFIHAALIAAGGKPGSPVQFINPKTDEPDYKPATGSPTAVTVVYRQGGQVRSHPAQEWILDRKTKKPMAHKWVFAGSRFMKNPDRPADPPFYCANNGEVISISNFMDSMLELPVEVSRDDTVLAFEARTDRIPPLLSKVWVVLEPIRAK